VLCQFVDFRASLPEVILSGRSLPKSHHLRIIYFTKFKKVVEADFKLYYRTLVTKIAYYATKQTHKPVE
jgi:hypothetical protein